MIDYHTAAHRGAPLDVQLRSALREGRVREILRNVLLVDLVTLAPATALASIAAALDAAAGYNRYRTAPRQDGYTRPSMGAVETAVRTGALGDVLMVRGVRNLGCARVKFYGARYSLDVGGFEWGYRGAGPLGLASALTGFGMPDAIDRVLAESRDTWIFKMGGE